MTDTIFVSQLTNEQYEEVERRLREVLQDDEENIERALSSRLCHLDETIEINDILSI